MVSRQVRSWFYYSVSFPHMKVLKRRLACESKRKGKTMSLKIYYMTGMIALVVAAGAAFFDKTVSFGVLLASLFSLINMYLLSLSMKQVISSQDHSPALMMAGNMIRFVLLFVMLYIAYRFPNLFSMVGVMIGVTLFMVALLIDAIGKRKGG